MAVRRDIPQIRNAILAVVEPELRSREIGQIADALGGLAEALAHAIVYSGQGNREDVQGLINTSARVVVTHARALLESLFPSGPVN